jgi:hypothetical protein
MGEINATDTKKMRLHRISTVNEVQINHFESRVIIYACSSTPTNAGWSHNLSLLRPLWPTFPYQQPPLTALRHLPARHPNLGPAYHQRRARRHLRNSRMLQRGITWKQP